MEAIFKHLKIILTFLGGILGWFLGPINSLVCSLISFVIVDYITGAVLAVQQNKLPGKIEVKEISKKITIFVMVGIGNVIDQYIIGAESTVRTMLIMFYLSNEGIIILENVANIGLPLPKRLINVIRQLNGINENQEDKP